MLDLRATPVSVPATLEAFDALAEERGWGDGLPLVPPTPERVRAMLDGWESAAQRSLGPMPPSGAEATVEALAVNAVMAGCRPADLPLLVAATDAVLEPAFNLGGIQPTTSPAAPAIVVNGPVAARLGYNGGSSAFGSGTAANARLGRALRLVLTNVGGAKPGGVDRSTHGSPLKYSFCFAENEAESPWEPLHVERGCEPGTSAVTVLGVAGLHSLVEFIATTGADVLSSVAANMTSPGTNNVSYGGEATVVLPPEHAGILRSEAWSKDDVRAFIFERARVDMTGFPPATQEMIRTRRGRLVDMRRVPVCDGPEHILVLVAGGVGSHAVFLPSFGPTKAATRTVVDADGEALPGS